MAWMIVDVGAISSALENTFRPTSEAPGAMPSMRIVHPGGSGWAALTKVEMSYVTRPCAAMELASPSASAPEVAALTPSPDKSW